MRTIAWMCIGFSLVLCFGTTLAAAQYLIEGLPIKVGDTYEEVKAAYQTNLKPEPTSTPGSTGLRLRTKGVWFFFNTDGAIYTIRLDAPFPGNIGGVKIGDPVDVMTSKLGNPVKTETGPIIGGSPIFTKYIYYPDDVTTASFQISKDKKIETVFLTKQAAPMNPVGLHNERGLQHYRNKDYTRAIAEFSEAIKLDPRSAAPYNKRANSYRALGDLERAARDYSEAIRIDPHPWIFYNRGKVHYLKKDFDRAIEDYDQAIKHGGDILDPEDMTDAYLYRGKSYYEKEEWLPAIVDFDEALRRAPNFMAATASRLLLIDDAAKECTDSPIAARKLRGCDAVIRTMQPSPLLAVALVERAVIYRGQGRVKEAIEDLKKVVAMGAARSSPPGDAAHQRATQILRELEK